MAIDIPKQEKNILKVWKREKIFEKSISQRKRARNFVFYEGPPTANAKPGIHHVLSRVYKDIICRYKTMAGFRVERKAGWDTHGLPVELEVEKKLGLKNKKDIEKYGIAKFNKKCRQSVWAYKKDWEKLTERIGFWLDMKSPYITYQSAYIETLWWLIKRIWQKGLLYKGYKVVPYCPRCGTSLSSHEVALGYKSVKEPAIYVKLKIKNSKLKISAQNTKLPIFLLVWTTTPWTLPGNVAIAVNPKLIYVAVKKDGEVLILAKERLGVLGKEYEILDEFKGKDLVGLNYEPLYEEVRRPEEVGLQNIDKVIPGDFVSAQEGTGLVHIAPAFGEDDMKVGKENNLPVLMTVNEAGRFKPEVKQWAGMFVKDADPLIIDDLKKRGLLFKEELYEHDYPFCWRCDSPLLYYAKESWFIKISKIKNELVANNKKINWIPSHIKEGRFGEWLKDVKDWAFSRERYWGTPLPIWLCQCGNASIIGSLKDFFSQKSSRNRYYFVRHGHSLRQTKGVAMCWPEKKRFSLTPLGRRQIKKTAKELAAQKIDIIFSSDLLRAKESAKIIAKETGAGIVFDKRLREYDVGIFNGQDPRLGWDYLQKSKDPYSTKLPKGESLRDVALRMYGFLRDINYKYRAKSIVIISHELPITLLEGALKGWSVEKTVKWRKFGKIDRIQTGEWREISFVDLPYNEQMELDFHRPYVDKVVFACQDCGGDMVRIPDVIDVWFDSGAMPFAQVHWPFAKNSKFQIPNSKQIPNTLPPKLFPADYISEAVDQTRGWFYTLLAVSTLLDLGPPYKNVISLGHVLDEKGEKMSKSKGNVVDPWLMLNKYGADAIRWYFFTLNQPGDVKLFAEKDIDLALKKFIMTFWNSYVFWKTYNKNSKLKTQNAKRKIQNSKFKIQNSEFRIQNVLDRWVISKLNGLTGEVTKKLDAYDVTGAARAIEDFTINDLSLWYIRRSRRRFQYPEKEQELREATYTLSFVLLQLSKLSAPFVPFMAELVYRGLQGNKESVHLENWPRYLARLSNPKLEKDMAIIREVVSKVLAERVKARIKVRQPLASLQVPSSKLQVPRELLDLIKDEVNVKKIIFGKTLKLDTKLTPELKEEGELRELVRQIQELRKKARLEPRHRILLFYSGSPDVIKIIEKHRERILAEVRADKLISVPEKKISKKRALKISFEGGSLHLAITPVKGRKLI